MLHNWNGTLGVSGRLREGKIRTWTNTPNKAGRERGEMVSNKVGSGPAGIRCRFWLGYLNCLILGALALRDHLRGSIWGRPMGSHGPYRAGCTWIIPSETTGDATPVAEVSRPLGETRCRLGALVKERYLTLITEPWDYAKEASNV